MKPRLGSRGFSSSRARRTKRSKHIASFSSHSEAEPLTESDYDTIVDRLAGIAAFRRAVDMQIEWLKNFPNTSRREEVESSKVAHLYLLRANDYAPSRAHT